MLFAGSVFPVVGEPIFGAEGAPFIHIEPMDMVAGRAPLGEEVNRPTVHPHRSHRQNHRQFLARIPRPLDHHGDFVAQHHVEVGDAAAGNRLKLFVPPLLPLGDCRGIVVDAGIDLREVPPGWQKPFHQRPGNRRQQIHRHHSRKQVFQWAFLLRAALVRCSRCARRSKATAPLPRWHGALTYGIRTGNGRQTSSRSLRTNTASPA